MATKRSMITIAVDAETKDRVRSFAQAAGVDVSTYVAAALSSAMQRDEQVARAFAPLDALIEDSERGQGAPDALPEVDSTEASAIEEALDAFFAGRGNTQRNAA